MSRRLTKELVLQWLKEAAGWEAGHNELFEYKHWHPQGGRQLPAVHIRGCWAPQGNGGNHLQALSEH